MLETQIKKNRKARDEYSRVTHELGIQKIKHNIQKFLETLVQHIKGVNETNK